MDWVSIVISIITFLITVRLDRQQAKILEQVLREEKHIERKVDEKAKLS